MRFPWTGRQERARTRLNELEDRLGLVESEARRIKVEWIEVLDRLERNVQRIVKVAAREKVAEMEQDVTPTVEDGASNVDPISAKILARRGQRLRGLRHEE